MGLFPSISRFGKNISFMPASSQPTASIANQLLFLFPLNYSLDYTKTAIHQLVFWKYLCESPHCILQMKALINASEGIQNAKTGIARPLNRRTAE